MKLTDNSSLNRYEWTAKKIGEIAARHFKTKDAVLYDIGARDNILKQYISSPAVNYKAFDMDPLDASAGVWNIENPFPYPYVNPDIVTMLEILEHLNNPWQCMKNVAEIMPDGYLILTTPNPAWSNSRFDFLRKGYLTCFTQSDLDQNHHVFTPWPHIVERLLHDNGFDILEYCTLDGKTRIFDQHIRGLSFALQLPFRFAKKVIESFDAASCGMSYGIIARKNV